MIEYKWANTLARVTPCDNASIKFNSLLITHHRTVAERYRVKEVLLFVHSCCIAISRPNHGNLNEEPAPVNANQPSLG